MLMNLFCLPYAGGSSVVIYKKWKEVLPSHIQLIPIELKGRGTRTKEKNYNSINEAIEDIFENNKILFSDTPYILYGHSMGAILAYELTLKIQEQKLQKPEHVFLSGRIAPDAKLEKVYHNMDFDTFVKEMRKLNGVPKEVIDNEPLMKYFFPIIQSDYKIIENYFMRKENNVLESEISIFFSEEDPMINNLKSVFNWQNFTNKSCAFYLFDGNHFFLNSEYEKILILIQKILNKNQDFNKKLIINKV